MPRLALRFISGKHKGGEFVLTPQEDIFIGRSSDIDLVLMEDMVSRKHARIRVENDQINIKDLGSTNGTFVNGERVSQATVKRGDRILIGTSIMKVVETDREPRTTRAEGMPVQRTTENLPQETDLESRSMIGTIKEVPLPDLIQLFSTSKKTGTVIIKSNNVVGKIHLKQGQLIYASLSDAPQLKPLKAIFRILSWNSGSFELVGPEQIDFPETIDMPTEHILMEGLRHLDELEHMSTNLPPNDAELVIVTPLMARLADLQPEELDVFQLVYNYGIVREVIDRANSSDLDAVSILVDLIKKDYVAQI
jgi:pSer/pThr/pTyr-binding forkhead associated (FHA) protein